MLHDLPAANSLVTLAGLKCEKLVSLHRYERISHSWEVAPNPFQLLLCQR